MERAISTAVSRYAIHFAPTSDGKSLADSFRHLGVLARADRADRMPDHRPRPDYTTLAKAADAGEPVSVDDLRAAFLAAPDFDDRMRQLAPLEQQALQLMID